MVYYSVLLVLLFEVFVSIVVGFGVYFGFTVFPFSPAGLLSAGDPVAGQYQMTITVPIAMPGLSDVKIPYTYLDEGTPIWGVVTFIVSAVMLMVQSFVRGMYLGGLRNWSERGSIEKLLGYGRKYFGRMLSWSVFQILYAVVMLFFTLTFFPLGIVLFIILLFYSLTPYLVVLHDIPFGVALAKAPRMFQACFKILFPLALIAMLSTSFISLLKQLPPSFGYAVPLLAYTTIGTALIYELMKLLSIRLPQLGEKLATVSLVKSEKNPARSFMFVLLLFVLTACGTLAASGYQFGILTWGESKSRDGIAYYANYSDVFYRSGQSYNSYEWDPDDEYRIELRLPDLSGEVKPEFIRGVATITWQMEDKVRYRHGNTTNTVIEPFIKESKLLYRLARETAADGSIYYSSERGSVSILPGGKQLYKPLSAEMMVSGDGSNVFVLQYPTEFEVSPVFRITDNGQYLAIGTSRMNPTDFHSYWFRESHQAEKVFEFLASKNRSEYVSRTDGIMTSLAAAMQEADGRMVMQVLDILKRRDVPLEVPSWVEGEWTGYLRSLYAGACFEETLKLLSNAGMFDGFREGVIRTRGDEQISVYQLVVEFPNDTLIIEYERSDEDHSLLSVSVFVGELTIE